MKHVGNYLVREIKKTETDSFIGWEWLIFGVPTEIQKPHLGDDSTERGKSILVESNGCNTLKKNIKIPKHRVEFYFRGSIS